MNENAPAGAEEKNGEADAQAPDRPDHADADGREEAEDSAAAELEALKEKHLRLSADFDNYRKRLAREKREIRDFGNAEMLKELLSVLDNIERAIELSENPPGGKTGMEAFLEGIRLVHAQFLGSLRSFGVTEVESGGGTAFDPGSHEAVSRQHSETYGSGTIISEVQKGYLLNGRLLRPSMVSVSRGPAEPPGKDGEEKD